MNSAKYMILLYWQGNRMYVTMYVVGAEREETGKFSFLIVEQIMPKIEKQWNGNTRVLFLRIKANTKRII